MALAHLSPAGDAILHRLMDGTGGPAQFLALLTVGLVSTRRGSTTLRVVPVVFLAGLALGLLAGHLVAAPPVTATVVVPSLVLVGIAAVPRGAPSAFVTGAIAAGFGACQGFAQATTGPIGISVKTAVLLVAFGVILGLIAREKQATSRVRLLGFATIAAAPLALL